MGNGIFSYVKLRKLYLKMESDQSEGWGPGQERPFEFVAKHLLADDGYSGPPFFLGPNAKAEREKFSEPELEEFRRAVENMLREWRCNDAEKFIKRFSDVAVEFFFDENEKRGQNAIDFVGFNPVYLGDIVDGLSPVKYLVKDVLAAEQPAVVAGPAKALKTGISIDLMLSLVFKRPFLGHFHVTESVNVGLFSGESGLPVIVETVQRIARAKGISLKERHENDCFEVFDGCFEAFDDGHMVLYDKLPILDNREHLKALERLILENDLDVVIIDPLYLALGVGMGSTSIFTMGNKLQDVMDLMRETGCTLILNHHFRKGKSVGKPDLEDMAAAGIQEYVRQWILLGRRKRYSPDKDAGHHELWLNIGGSAGHSFEAALDIDEGPPRAPQFGDGNQQSPHPDHTDLEENSPPESGRKWDVTVRPASAVKSSGRRKQTTGENSETAAVSGRFD